LEAAGAILFETVLGFLLWALEEHHSACHATQIIEQCQQGGNQQRLPKRKRNDGDFLLGRISINP
jgi:hypothetical protein